MQRFEFIERNKYAYPNTTTNFNGYTNLKYRLEGNNLFMIPIPQTGQVCQLWYIPAPTSLQYNLSCGLTVSSTVLTVADSTGLTQGMSVSGSGIPNNTTISGFTSSTSIVISNQATITKPYGTVSFWRDDTVLDGISGWEEYVIIDASIKGQIKQENDIQPLLVQKMAMKERIEGMVQGRDAGQAHHVSDALSVNSAGRGYGGWDGGDGGYW